MSSATPPGDTEYLEIGGATPRKPHRGLVVGIIAGVVVALGLPLGVFAVFRFLSGGGTQPHDVLPGNAVGYFRIDLDPSGAEKIDAMRFLRTFPAFEKYTRLTDDRADVRGAIVDAMLDDAACDLRFTEDVEPWLGHRFGIAVTAPSADSNGAPGVVGALQVSDEQAAREGLQALRACGGNEGTGDDLGGWTYLDGYMVVAEDQQQAERFAAAATRSPLGDDEQFVQDMDRLGDPGVASAWFDGQGLYQVFNSQVIGDPGPAGGEFDLLRDDVRRQIDDNYRSGAVAFRFDARYAELATVLTGEAYDESAGGRVADLDLPRSTALAFGFADGAEQVDQQWEALLDMYGGRPGRLERKLGVELPADLQTLVGDSFTMALDGSDLDFGAMVSGAGPAALDLGVRVDTDVAAFSRVVEKLEAAAARDGVPVELTVRESDRGVVAALNDAYAGTLAAGAGLTETDAFQTAVPDAETAQGVLFFNFDMFERPFADSLGRLAGPQSGELADNLTKVEALGMSATNHDGYAAAALRITVAE
jgi:hypothetical protein